MVRLSFYPWSVFAIRGLFIRLILLPDKHLFVVFGSVLQ